MFYKSYYKDKTEEEIYEDIKKEGFDSIIISNGPGYVYSEHQHKETKLLVCLEGSMKVEVGDESYNFEKGDKLIVKGDIKHSGVVGNSGCKFYWSEKII